MDTPEYAMLIRADLGFVYNVNVVSQKILILALMLVTAVTAVTFVIKYSTDQYKTQQPDLHHN